MPLGASLATGHWLSSERLRRFSLLFLVAALSIIAADWFAHTRHGVVDATGQQLGRDFVSHWAGGRLAGQGHAALAYDIEKFVAFERSLTAPNAELKWYGYPPTNMLLCLPFGLLPFIPALLVWIAAGVVLVAAAMARTLGWRYALVASIAAPAAIMNVIAGENGAFSAALLAGGVALVDRRPVLAGVLFGLLTYKPHLGLMIPIALIAGGYWRVILSAGLTAVLLAVVSGLTLGWDAWAGFLANAGIHGALLEANSGMWPRMPTVYLAARWLGAPSIAAYAIQAVSALGAAAAVFAVWRSGATLRIKGLALMTATFLASPYAWDYDTVVLVVGAVWFWAQANEDGWRPWEKTMIGLLLAAPLFTPWLALYAHLQIAPLVFGCMLALTVRRALAPRATEASLAPLTAAGAG